MLKDTEAEIKYLPRNVRNFLVHLCHVEREWNSENDDSKQRSYR